jgi:cbb3-type cytochrome oxidase maturation protein
MDALIFLGVLTLALAAFGVASQLWGVDSRDFSDDPRSPVGGIELG